MTECQSCCRTHQVAKVKFPSHGIENISRCTWNLSVVQHYELCALTVFSIRLRRFSTLDTLQSFRSQSHVTGRRMWLLLRPALWLVLCRCVNYSHKTGPLACRTTGSATQHLCYKWTPVLHLLWERWTHRQGSLCANWPRGKGLTSTLQWCGELPLVSVNTTCGLVNGGRMVGTSVPKLFVCLFVCVRESESKRENVFW